jgi:ATP-binding cassette subfamily F protein 3
MITFDNLSKHYGGATLLDNVSAAFHETARTGLIGVNGSGKTTVLRMLAGQETPDKGGISKPSCMTIGYLPQEVELFDDQTPLEIVLGPFRELLDYEKKLEQLGGHAGADDARVDEVMEKLEKLHHDLEFHDVYSLSSRAEAILAGLGVPRDKWMQPVLTLSGGYRMRTVLGRLLLSSPDFLLLDEPTNHLDMDSLVWLEKFLTRYKGGMLIVSHDRDFLNRMTDYTAEVRNRAVTMYKGNYDEFVRMSEQHEQQERSRLRNLQLQIAEKERFVERFKAKNTKATQAQSRMKQIEKLKEQVPELAAETRSIRFTFPQPQPSGGIPLKLRDVAMRYGATPVFSGLTLDVNRGDKIAIVGPNGAGKSTLLKLMAGLIVPLAGTVEQGHGAVVRYFGQHQMEQLDMEKTCYDTVAAVAVKTEKTFVRGILGAFLFSGDSVDKPVRVLSGGEKSRLVLATILASPGNTLLLDEPTNHLDINSIETLSGALLEYTGTVLVVSHDDYFISKVATRIIEMRPGLVRDFPGTLADYRSYVEQGLWGETEIDSKEKQSAAAVEIDDKEKRIRERDERKRLQRTVEKLEREIETREAGLAKLAALLEDPVNASNHSLLHETSKSIDLEKVELDDLIVRWEREVKDLEALG